MDYINCSVYALGVTGAVSPHRMTHVLNNAPSLRILSGFTVSYGHSKPMRRHAKSDFSKTCNTIAATVSGASQVFFPRACANSYCDAPI
jgi:hypothetical protein